MLESIRIERFRGLKQGRLDGLSRLSVLTGLNGTGKTSVMEASRLITAVHPGAALAEIVKLRLVDGGAKWLVQDPYARLVAGFESETVTYTVERADPRFRKNHSPAFHEGLVVSDDSATEESPKQIAFVEFNQENEANILADCTRRTSNRWIRSWIDSPEAAYSDLVRGQHEAELNAVMSRAIKNFEGLTILVESDDRSQLYIKIAGSAIPLAAAGDGAVAIANILMNIAGEDDETIFIEEPENYLHPRAMLEVAQALADSARRPGPQFILSTHSLEFIDMLEQSARCDNTLAVFNLELEDGELRAHRFDASEVSEMRADLELDLR